MTWLVSGGAGYIGAHVVRALQRAGLDVVVLDDLSSGRPGNAPAGVPLVRGSVQDRETVESVVLGYDVTGVIHLVGPRYGGFSSERPLSAYDENGVGLGWLLAMLVEHGVDKFVYSSSAAVYGTPSAPSVSEADPRHPETSYGRVKLIGEWLLEDVGRATGMRHTSLRIVNVAGSAAPAIADSNPYHLLPRVFGDLRSGRTPHIHGDDFPTPDGTPVRDFVHVLDVARAHVAAAQRLERGEPVESAYNLGTGEGVSVRQVMESIERVSGVRFEPDVAPRRPGDPPRLVAKSLLAQRDLDWQPEFSLDDAVSSSWAAWRAIDSSA